MNKYKTKTKFRQRNMSSGHNFANHKLEVFELSNFPRTQFYYE